MVYELIEHVFNRGMLTRKVIHDIQHKTLEWVGSHKQTFDFYRERVEEFAAAKRKAHRGEIIVALSTIGWNGIFRADDIAEILLDTDTKEVARERALAKLDEIEGKYNENNRKAAILRKGISQVIPKKWTYKMSVSASNVLHFGRNYTLFCEDICCGRAIDSDLCQGSGRKVTMPPYPPCNESGNMRQY